MPDELLAELDATAKKLRRSKGWIINDAVREYLVKEERKARIVEDTREALADIRAGRVIESADIIDWLETWVATTKKLLLNYEIDVHAQRAEGFSAPA
ncbi:MAG: ribbon-helix-helix protein, CopG family [Halioglobus sp.]|nr:ribbon-helix-helix protein, CopG family [Halioglobus sp.]